MTSKLPERHGNLFFFFFLRLAVLREYSSCCPATEPSAVPAVLPAATLASPACTGGIASSTAALPSSSQHQHQHQHQHQRQRLPSLLVPPRISPGRLRGGTLPRGYPCRSTAD